MMDKPSKLAVINYRDVHLCPDPEAAIALYKAMRALTLLCHHREWTHETEARLWMLVESENPSLFLLWGFGHMNMDQIQELRILSRLCDGWWCQNLDISYPEYTHVLNLLRLDEWRRRYKFLSTGSGGCGSTVHLIYHPTISYGQINNTGQM